MVLIRQVISSLVHRAPTFVMVTRTIRFPLCSRWTVYEGQWAIVGYFTIAQGYITKKGDKEVDASLKVIELVIYATFRSTEIQLLEPYRDGPKGGSGGPNKIEPQRVPWRLERVKLNHGDCIVSFEYSYIDIEINFGPTEYAKEIGRNWCS
nr:uncharacterized protein LOC117866926 isoform X2 [Setaria viridis]